MTTDTTPRAAIRVRDVLRWWPVVVLTVAAAVLACLPTLASRTPEYTAGTRLLVAPLAQWDETFLGTSLSRYAGDAGRTTATVAAQLDTDRVADATARQLGPGWTSGTVAADVDVTGGEGADLIDIVARADDPATARRLADTFTSVALADRWTTISTELTKRIELMTPRTSTDPNAGEASLQLQLVRLVLESGVDPTLRVDSVMPPALVPQLPAAAILGLAGVGGLFIGLLAAIGLALLQSRRRAERAQARESAKNGVAHATPRAVTDESASLAAQMLDGRG